MRLIHESDVAIQRYLKKRLTRIEEKVLPLPIDIGSHLEPLDLDAKAAV